jgi:hypothetical protein
MMTLRCVADGEVTCTVSCKAYREGGAWCPPIADEPHHALTTDERAAIGSSITHANEASCWSCEDAPFATVERILAARLAAADARDTNTRAAAWDEGWNAAMDYASADYTGPDDPPNPYAVLDQPTNTGDTATPTRVVEVAGTDLRWTTNVSPPDDTINPERVTPE